MYVHVYFPIDEIMQAIALACTYTCTNNTNQSLYRSRALAMQRRGREQLLTHISSVVYHSRLNFGAHLIERERDEILQRVLQVWNSTARPRLRSGSKPAASSVL